jgi:putative ABC transport system substrate-binding protein
MFMTLIGGLAIAWPLACYAQQPNPASPKRVGLLAVLGCPLAQDHPTRRRLAELGWVEGQTFVFECVSTVGRLDQIPALARELVLRRPDVLLTGPSYFVMALKQETTTIPIVMIGAWEPVRQGLVTSLARPEGNVTGIAWFGLLAKQLELLREIVPRLRRVAVIQAINPPRSPEFIKIQMEGLRTTESALGLALKVFPVSVANDYDEIFARIAAEHFDAAYIPSDPLSNLPVNIARIGQLSLRHQIPAVGEGAAYAKGRLLFSYGQDVLWSTARAAEYIDKILRGAKPGDLPVEQATKLDLVINLKTAKELGITIPPSVLARADEVIE